MTKQDLKTRLDEFIENQELEELAHKTLVSYRNAVNKFIEFVPDNEEITKTIVKNWKGSLVEKYKIKSRNQYIVVVNKFLAFIGYEICCVKQFKEQEKSSLEDQIEPQEHKRMLRWAKKLDMMEIYYIIKTFAESGARISELQYFTVEKIESNYIKGAYNKGKERTLIIPNELRRSLKQYCRENKIKTGYIFRSPDPNLKDDPNRLIDPSTVWRQLKKIAKAAKINPNKIHAHAWRHLFAKQCKEAGIELDELMDLLGHTDMNTTALYTRTSMKEKRIKLERLWKK
ncbi:MAG: tyrosine-type recombinase/integrase [Bacilli bacterium]|nr:tyrosine-type recombinase/integrase [Bacilli bacterium]